MSSLIVPVVVIDEIIPHPDPETIALEIAKVLGWQVVVRKGTFKVGQRAVYFPLDAVLPERLSDIIGVTKYISKGRIRPAKLRGVPSYGLLWDHDEASNYIFPPPFDFRNFSIGQNLAESLGVTKWEPPLNLNVGDAASPHPAFIKYTDIVNLRNYPDVLKDGEDVIITEKLHGTNARHGIIEGKFVAGGHNVQFKENPDNRMWHVFSDDLKNMLTYLSEKNDNANVIAYGEVIGVQDLKYGYTKGHVGYRCFDISVNGVYMNYDEWFYACLKFGVPMVPVLDRLPFNMTAVLKHSTSKTTLEGVDHIMEGVVIKPTKERMNVHVGRVILKYVFSQYLIRHGGTEFH